LGGKKGVFEGDVSTEKRKGEGGGGGGTWWSREDGRKGGK